MTHDAFSTNRRTTTRFHPLVYRAIIALAGLGVVVVKALGGEEVPMKAGATLVYPPNANFERTFYPKGPSVYRVPPGTTYQFGPGERETMLMHENFTLTVPREHIVPERLKHQAEMMEKLQREKSMAGAGT